MRLIQLSILYASLFIWSNSLPAQLIAEYYDTGTLESISTGGAAAATSTFDLDTDCEAFRISVTNPANNPLPSFNAYIFRTNDAAGDPVLDITDNVNVTMRVRSLEAVRIDILFRSGGGTSSERSDRKGFDVPAGLDEWTEFTLTWETSDLAGFVPTDLRDMWFYLDRGTENFAGNELYIDHIVIGGMADAARNSPCMLGDPTAALISDYYEGDSLASINTNSSAGQVSTFVLDTLCEAFSVSVTDPVNEPLSAFNAYIFRTNDTEGNPVVDISDNVNVTMRVRSLEAVRVEILFRSGGGGSSERSDRKGFDVPTGLDEWTEFTLTWEAGDLAGFVPTDLRDMWFYLDRGTENFAGNEFYIDHIVVGGMADAERNSPCMLGGPMEALISDYYEGDSLASINTENTAGLVTTFVLDTLCEAFSISVTDPANAPLSAFSPYVFRTNDEEGNPVSDITDNVNVTMRVRSAEAVNLEVLFRSGKGTSGERTDRKGFSVPAGLDDWTEFTLTWEAGDLAGFDPTTLRDMWFYLDRGDENFAGNEFYVDHIVIGGMADPERNSPCTSFSQPTSFEEYFTGDSLTTINTESTAALVTNFSLDTICEVLLLSITDPNLEPLPPFNAYIVNPLNDAEEITNIEGIVNTTFRVSSLEAVTIGILFRSGEGTTSERSSLKSFTVPAGLDQWTEFTLSWDANELEGFDPTDLRDMWFYLDRGVANFAGNQLYIDHITIGTAPDANQNSNCVFVDVPQNWTENWNTDTPTEFTGSDVERLNITIDTTCEEVQLEVIDPTGNPYQAFRPLALNPVDENGLDIGLINENPFVNIRARSAETVELGVLLRSRDGTADFRTDLLTQTIIGDLTGYSNLVFEFDAASLGGFDREDFLDIWIYLDREVDNFAGNEVYIDYVSLGERPDLMDYSPCGLPDIIIDNTEDLILEAVSIYPNPTTDRLTVDIPSSNQLKGLDFEVVNVLGQTVLSQRLSAQHTLELDVSALDSGVYYLNMLIDNRVVRTEKFIKL
ncbi:MAG: T9SS type A sorting domain-containing protein [Bacteroidota bacterium]